MGCNKNTPTAAIEILLDIPTLHIFIQSEALRTDLRNKQLGTTATTSSGTPSLKRLLDTDETITLADTCIPKHVFTKNYTINFPDRHSWLSGAINFPVNSEIWFTDGSQMDNRTGYGITNPSLNIKHYGNMGTHMTVFLAEISAINVCTNLITDRGTVNRTIIICSDSSSALKALDKH